MWLFHYIKHFQHSGLDLGSQLAKYHWITWTLLQSTKLIIKPNIPNNNEMNSTSKNSMHIIVANFDITV